MRSGQSSPAPISRTLLSDIGTSAWPRVVVVAGVIVAAAALESLWYLLSGQPHLLVGLLLIPASALVISWGWTRGADWDLRRLLKLFLVGSGPSVRLAKKYPWYAGPHLDRQVVLGRQPLHILVLPESLNETERQVHALLSLPTISQVVTTELTHRIMQEHASSVTRPGLLDLRSAGLTREVDLALTLHLICSHMANQDYRSLKKELKQYLADLEEAAPYRRPNPPPEGEPPPPDTPSPAAA